MFCFQANPTDLPKCIKPGLTRLSLGIMYLTIFQVGCSFFTEAYMLSNEFYQHSFIRKCFYLALWAKCHLYKYISCWLITEGALITFSKYKYSSNNKHLFYQITENMLHYNLHKYECQGIIGMSF